MTAAAPAGVLRALCTGGSCNRPVATAASVPFCSLPDDVRSRLAAGFRESRSPDVMGVTSGESAVGGRGGAAAWPSLGDTGGQIPIVFAGVGVSGAPVPAGTGLDDVAPTLERITGVERPHPEVRSGRALAGVASGGPPRLVLEVVWRGVGSDDLEESPGSWPYLNRLMERGSATTEAMTGSLPLDPAATLTTLGTGGLPRQHGVTGEIVHNDLGGVVRAWGPGAPPSVIATLADDLDETLGGRPRIGLVGTGTSDRGVTGGRWYADVDQDDFLVRAAPPATAAAAVELLAEGYGSDKTPDLLGVILEGRMEAMDGALRRVVEAARRAAGGSVTTVVTATGREVGRAPIPARRVEAAVEAAVPGRGAVVEATVAGGLFLDQEAMARRRLPQEQVVDSLLATRRAGRRVFADAFPKIAVTFARYC
ncbi:MAG: alkaline phosphatase family protein [Actinomycetota bacterium]|nr:alkaline phosphatase family protein [Actinomycetota bacterium]